MSLPCDPAALAHSVLVNIVIVALVLEDLVLQQAFFLLVEIPLSLQLHKLAVRELLPGFAVRLQNISVLCDGTAHLIAGLINIISMVLDPLFISHPSVFLEESLAAIRKRTELVGYSPSVHSNFPCCGEKIGVIADSLESGKHCSISVESITVPIDHW